ncbi:hypothetical protein LTR37_021069 [Vermiconidia calcicola]|uniref:Uncharacterized protein n=1 Tax=Vermiconidia calcicola TaxID=1690605 RepID=A0ACC3MCL9_9PEZI|nr:hypothetical protein LTR37_021069 [Vermiconidia calcicola]
MFTACHPVQSESRTTPFFQCASGPASFYADPPTAMRSIRALTEFDADPNILTLIAHDPGPNYLPMNFFPNGTINDWQEKGWKDAIYWYFLNELPFDEGKVVKQPLIDGKIPYARPNCPADRTSQAFTKTV